MKERFDSKAKRVTLSVDTKKEIKHGQGCACGVCGQVLPEEKLEVHHIKPVCFFKKGEGELANQRSNLVALCHPCHEWADFMVLREGRYLNELIDLQINEESTVVPQVRKLQGDI